MRKGTLIANVVVIVWGGAVLAVALTGGGSGGGYGAGHVIATVFALVLVFAGWRGVRRELRRRAS